MTVVNDRIARDAERIAIAKGESRRCQLERERSERQLARSERFIATLAEGPIHVGWRPYRGR